MTENKIDVVIDGIKYTMLQDQGDDRTIKIANYIDQKIGEIRNTNSRLNQTMVYVLTLMNITGELFDKKDKYDSLVEESKEPIQRFQSISEEVERIGKEKEEMTESIEKLKDDLVISLNTISDINKRYSQLNEENKGNLEKIDQKNIQMNKLMDNLASLQKEMSEIQKNYQTIVKKLESENTK